MSPFPAFRKEARLASLHSPPVAGARDGRETPARSAKVLIVHDFYRQPGGEDQVFASEAALLRQRHHEVITFTMHNDAVDRLGRVRLAGRTVWNDAAYRAISDLVRRERPLIVHFHNTFPLISPAGYYAAKRAGAAVVQTLHNYRLLCPAATFHRDGRSCEDCLGRQVPWPSLVHRCYRHSVSATAAAAGMITYHRVRGTWRRAVDAYIALSEYGRRKFLEGGLPESKLSVKPNFLDRDPGEQPGGGGYFVFVGRLTPEKGVRCLLDAWAGPLRGLAHLKIVGDGPMRDDVLALSRAGAVEYMGWRPADEVRRILGDADALVFPSIWQEPCPRTIIESYALGTPVIASGMPSLAALVKAGQTGLVYEPGTAGLIGAVSEAVANPALLPGLRHRARQEFLDCYTADRNYSLLLQIYNRASAASLAGAHRTRERVYGTRYGTSPA